MTDVDDITGLWAAAILKYREATGINLFATSQVESLDNVIKLTVDKEDHFVKWRDDGGKSPGSAPSSKSALSR